MEKLKRTFSVNRRSTKNGNTNSSHSKNSESIKQVQKIAKDHLVVSPSGYYMRSGGSVVKQKERDSHSEKPALPPKKSTLTPTPSFSATTPHDDTNRASADTDCIPSDMEGSDRAMNHSNLTIESSGVADSASGRDSPNASLSCVGQPLVHRQKSKEKDKITTFKNPLLKLTGEGVKSKSKINFKYVRVHGEVEGAYKNDSEPRGCIFIKNFQNFEDDIYEERKGSKQDYDSLLELFECMGYQNYKKNQWCSSGRITKEKFMRDLQSFAQHDHTLFSSAIIIIMSHGVRDKTFVTSDNQEVDLMEVYETLNNQHCNTLRNKPKIFILQFCRPKSDMPTSPSYASLNPSTVEDTVDRRLAAMKQQIIRQIEFQLPGLIEKALQERENSSNDPMSSSAGFNRKPKFSIDNSYLSDQEKADDDAVFDNSNNATRFPFTGKS